MEGNERQEDNPNYNKNPAHPWCVVESKSRPGYKYLYNIETTESIWIPCEAQVDKAKCNTYSTHSQPEAKGNLVKDVAIESDGSLKMYKNQVNNNQFLNQNGGIKMDENGKNIYNPITFVNTAPVHIPTVSTYNHDVWTVPPTAQFILTPTITPVINQPQILQPQVLLPISLPQNIVTHPVREFRNGSPNRMNEKLQGCKLKSYNINCDVNRRYNMHRKFNPKRKIDLMRKHFSNEYIYHNSNVYNNDGESDSHFEIVCDDGTRYQRDQGIHKYLDTSQQVDLTVIRNLAASSVNQEQWFIVADGTVIQENFIFLNTLIDSDNKCRMMVPQCVFTELHSLAKDPSAVNIRRIFRFISTEIEVGNRWIADSFINADRHCSPFDLCLKLSSENYHVVLLSHDKEYLQFKSITHVPVFTIQEFKNIMAHSCSIHKSIEGKLSKERRVFVINDEHGNNTDNSNITSKHSFMNQYCCLPKPCNINDKQETIVKENRNDKSQNSLSIGKISTEVQSALHVQENGNGNGMALEVANVDEHSTITTDTASVVSYNRRVIKLKQNGTNQKQINNSKKRWSNRKRTNDGRNINLSSTDNSIGLVSTSSKQSDMEQQMNDVLKEVTGCKDDKNSDDLLCNTSECVSVSDQNSEPCKLLKKKKTDIVINKSSGLILTAESALDSESTARHQQISSFDPDEPNIKVMFEITNKNIEDYFTVRSDEWISRYVQIMEEVLSQVLNQEPPFVSDEFPAPWTLKEAAQCVIKKYSNRFYIVDAANNLSTVIHRASDISGKMSVNMKPSEFMVLYSYGMYLVKALLKVCDSCEDLHNAAESLNELLRDIYNHDIDCLNNSFNNRSREAPAAGQVSTPSSDDVVESRNRKKETLNEESVGQRSTSQCSRGKSSAATGPASVEYNAKLKHETIGAVENLQTDEEFESAVSGDKLEDNVKNFKHFIGLFVKEISKVLTRVHTLCKNFIASEYTHSDSDKADVYRKLELARGYIHNIYKSLQSILSREAEDPGKNIQSLMKRAGIHMTIDQSLNDEYRSIISKCMDQVQEYLSYINLVITLHKETIV